MAENYSIKVQFGADNSSNNYNKSTTTIRTATTKERCNQTRPKVKHNKYIMSSQAGHTLTHTHKETHTHLDS